MLQLLLHRCSSPYKPATHSPTNTHPEDIATPWEKLLKKWISFAYRTKKTDTKNQKYTLSRLPPFGVPKTMALESSDLRLALSLLHASKRGGSRACGRARGKTRESENGREGGERGREKQEKKERERGKKKERARESAHARGWDSVDEMGGKRKRQVDHASEQTAQSKESTLIIVND